MEPQKNTNLGFQPIANAQPTNDFVHCPATRATRRPAGSSSANQKVRLTEEQVDSLYQMDAVRDPLIHDPLRLTADSQPDAELCEGSWT